MKALLRLTAVVAAGTAAALVTLPLLVASVLAGQLHLASQLAAEWDIPAEVVPALQEAGQRRAVPWFLLAGIGSVATDFARHAPDGRGRGDAPGTAIFPVVIPAIGQSGAGEGLFLVDRARAGVPLADPQDVRQAADWLAAQLAPAATDSALAARPLSDPAAGQYWQQILASAPLRIAGPASTGAGSAVTPVDPGASPLRQFGAAVMARIAAPSTSANLDAFAAWAAGEGTCARFNPLATTQPEAGATPFNTLSGGGHVWNYPGFDVGVRATTTALTNGLYQPVIAAFQASAGVASVAAAVERSPWGTKHFGSPGYAGRACPSGPAPAPAPAPLPTVAGPEAVPATIVARALRYQAIWSDTATLWSLRGAGPGPTQPPPPTPSPARGVVTAASITDCNERIDHGDPVAVAAAAVSWWSCGSRPAGVLSGHGQRVVTGLGRLIPAAAFTGWALLDSRAAPVVMVAVAGPTGHQAARGVVLTLFWQSSGWVVDDVAIVARDVGPAG